MDLQLELFISAKLIVAMLFGCLIGLEREKSQKQAGIRTFGAIAVAACIFVSIGRHLTDDKSAIARIIASIATGLGFIGAGLIFKDRNENMQGLTSTAALWGTSAIGGAVALDMYLFAFTSTLLIYLLLSLNSFGWYQNSSGKIPT